MLVQVTIMFHLVNAEVSIWPHLAPNRSQYSCVFRIAVKVYYVAY